MTHLELSQRLTTRVGFRPALVGDFIPDLLGSGLSDSGRYFQDEHNLVTLDYIRACQKDIIVDSDDSLFESYLLNLRQKVTLKVVHDVFKQVKSIKENVIAEQPVAFDEAISLRMVIEVGEMIIASSRTGGLQRVAESIKGDFYRELNGVRSENSNQTSKYTTISLGIIDRYNTELDSLKNMFKQHKRLSTSTAGDFPYLNGYRNGNLIY